MKTLVKTILSAIVIFFAVLAMINPAMAATNTAADPGGGGVALSASGAVEVTSTALQLVKQVYIGGICYASQPADAANCNGGATTVNVPAGTAVDFLIYVNNTIPFTATDARIQDAIDDSGTGFQYVAGSMTWNTNSTATAAPFANIFTDAAATPLLDATGVADIASAQDLGGTAGQVDIIDIGLPTNLQLDIPGSQIFALRFQAIKK